MRGLYVQWKGTDICADLHCDCGHHTHVCGDFMYTAMCEKCEQHYRLDEHITITKVDKDWRVGDGN